MITTQFKLSFLGILLLFPILSIHAQNFSCGTDENLHQLMMTRPDLRPGIIRADQQLRIFTQQFEQAPTPKSGDPYIIPVVFHVIHNYGAENITDAQILDAVKQVNIQFRKLNPDTSEIVTAFQSIAADAGIEIRLAQLDPDGNCTSGITRTASTLTYIGDHQVKSLIQWPPDKYLNVYICSEAAGLAGHALLPAAADTIPEWDGIVMQHSYIGTFGTSDFFRRTVLSHEIGHYLNLQHIWGGNNVPDFYYLPVAQAANCSHDDEVSDTPLTIGWQTCNLNGQSCGSLDNVQNYMDYAYCARMFTEGQKTRMHACLNSPIANRNNLWTPQNLIATGTDDLTFYLCEARWSSSKKTACVGNPIEFTDVSFHGPRVRTWSFDGGTASSTSDSVVSVNYSTPGFYDVSLSVTHNGQTKTTTLENYIHILPEEGQTNFISESFENISTTESQLKIIQKGMPFNWENTNYGFESNRSLFVNGFEASTTGVYEFETYPIDVSGENAVVIAFDFAYAQKQTGNLEFLRVSTSTDCGETWNIRKSYLGSSSLKTVSELRTDAFYPANDIEWKSDVITNIPVSALTENLRVKFTFEAKSGNNIFIDNIQIMNPAVLQLSGLKAADFILFPNPSMGVFQIQSTYLEAIKSLQIYEMNGQLVKTYIGSETNFHEPVSIDLSAGIYLLSLHTEAGVFHHKLQIGH